MKSAVGDTQFVVGFSRRPRSVSIPVVELTKAVEMICSRLESGPVALVFGREDDGLDNEEISRCDIIARIETSDKFASLNLAQAVIIVCYELSKFAGQLKKDDTTQFITHKEMEPAFEHLEAALFISERRCRSHADIHAG